MKAEFFKTHYKIEFGFGVAKDRNQKEISAGMVAAAMTVIRRRAAEMFGAYTLTPTSGGWTNPAGVLVEEPGYTLSVILPGVQFTQDFANYIKGALDQEAVAVTITPVNFQII